MARASILLRIFTILLLNFLCYHSFPQSGHIFISNYDVDETFVDSKINCIEFDFRSFGLVGNRKGVSIFDGVKWEKIKSVPDNVYSIKSDTSTNKVFIGLKGEVGFIQLGEDGKYKYNNLITHEKPETEFTHITLTNTQIIFYSAQGIYFVNKNNYADYTYIGSEDKLEFTGIIEHKNKVYINVKSKGLQVVKENALVPTKAGKSLLNSKILFYTRFNNKQVIVGTNRNKIFLFDGKKLIQFAKHTEIRDFLEENILWKGTDISDTYFAVTTLTGGCALIDKTYGKIVDVINYQTGLPDDEVSSIGIDANKGIWLSHDHGLSRCDINLPLKNYNTYPGLSGNINDIILKNQKLYVATNDGVYYLDKIHKKDIIAKSSNSNDSPTKGTSKNKKNKKSRKNTVREPETRIEVIPLSKRKQYIEQSITHKYYAIRNLNEKCKELYLIDNHLLVATNYGLYEIIDDIALPIVTNTYVTDLCKDNDSAAVYLSSLKGIDMLTYKSGTETKITGWKKKNLLKQLSFPAYSIEQDKDGNLLIGSEGKVYKSERDSNLIFREPQEMALPEKINEAIIMKKINDEIYLIQTNKIFRYSETERKFYHEAINLITLGYASSILDKNNAWSHFGNGWIPIVSSKDTNNYKFLNLFSKVRKIYSQDKEGFWVINGIDELVKIAYNSNERAEEKFSIFILSVTDNNENSYKTNHPRIKYYNNAIKIRLTAPYYYRPEQIKYQYYIKGLKNYNKWSEWTTSSLIELSSLPAGNYEFRFRAKNIFGNISEENRLVLTILKPFWQTKPFYISLAVGFLIFTGLLFYLTHRRLLKKKKYLERKIRERTFELQVEKDRTETLLLNILPKETAEELKKHNKVTPRNYDDATVLFTDFKGFTFMAEKMSPKDLVDEIDYCFKEFDRIIGKYKIEKIKTIGDAYMCAGGLPTRNKNNSIEVIKAALDIRDFMEEYKTYRQKEKKPFFEIRIGVHTGKVVAGVVGTKKYAYDIWGDTVNIAARMESSGEVGKVNISEITHELVKNKFVCKPRGKVKAKNKGEVEMYFVEKIK